MNPYAEPPGTECDNVLSKLKERVEHTSIMFYVYMISLIFPQYCGNFLTDICVCIHKSE